MFIYKLFSFLIKWKTECLNTMFFKPSTRNKILNYIKYIVASSARAEACDCKLNSLWIWFPLWKINYLIFWFLLSDNKANCGVNIRHSTRNASRIRRKVGNGSVLIGKECLNNRFPGYLCLPCFYVWGIV